MKMRKTIVILALACACGPTVATPGEDGTTSGDDTLEPTTTSTTTSDPSTTLPGTSANPTSATTATTIDPDDTSADESSSTTEVCTSCCDFVCPPDGGDSGLDGGCDVWSQDCPDGEKCMPWANDGDKYWNSSRCSPVDGTPAQIGDACTVEGSGVSGIDDCALGLMCFWVDPITGEGTCVANCGNSEADPMCKDPATTCVIDFDGVIALCLPACDPLLQDCAQGMCSPFGVHEAEGFACGAPLPPLVPDGDPCEHDWECNPGSMCPNGDEEAPACDDGPCCTPLCALDDPEACADGFVCTQLLPDSPLPGFDLVGYCALP